MSEENVEIVRRLYGAVDRGDTEAVLDIYAPDVEWDFTRSPFGLVVSRDVYQGHDGIRDFIRERLEEAMENAIDELEELIDAGDRVVSVIRSHGRGRTSGVPIEITHAAVWTVGGGKVLRVEWMTGREEALEAAGLTE